MIGLDTNVVVRHLVQDDPLQSAAAAQVVDSLTEDDPGFLSLVTIVELYWVLRRAYKTPSSRCVELIEGLLNAREIRVDQASHVRAALASSREGLDFADALIVQFGQAAGCDHTVTLDRRAASTGRMRLLPTGDAPPRP